MRALFFLLVLWLLPVSMARTEPMFAPVKKTSSLATKALRPVIRVIHGITDDLRWVLGLFALGEFFIKRGDYDIYNSIWLRLWLGALVVHAVCEQI